MCSSRHGRKAREKKEDSEALVPGLNVVLLRLLASAVPFASRDVTLGRKLPYISCQLERQMLLNFQKDYEQTGGTCCEETTKLLASAFLRD